MMISTKGRYALQVMLDLAQQCPDAYISLHDISQRQAVSMKYLEAIVAMLNKAGMVESRRGKSGGYRLTRARRTTPWARLKADGGHAGAGGLYGL